jgi:hypothetical protein
LPRRCCQTLTQFFIPSFFPSSPYQTYREAQGLAFPALFATEREFVDDMRLFLATAEGGLYRVNDDVAIKNDSLLFFKVEVTTVSVAFTSRALLMPAHDAWQAQMLDFNAQAKQLSNLDGSFQRGIQTNFISWPWMASEQAFLTSAVQGLIISFAVSYIVLVRK